MTEKEHGELCVYLDEWLGQFNKLRPSTESSIYSEWRSQMGYAKLMSETLAELILIDVTEARL